MKAHKAKKDILEHLRKTPIIEIACSKAGIGRTSFYRYKNSDKAFAAAVDEALAEGNSFVSDLAESQLISAIKERDIRAIALWLRHHHPTYKNRIEVMAQIKKEEALTPEQEATVRKALELASLSAPEEITEKTEPLPPAATPALSTPEVNSNNTPQ